MPNTPHPDPKPHAHYAEVAVYSAVEGTFDYHIPDDLRVQVGHLVRVSFGTNTLPAIVLRIKDQSDIASTKPIAEILDDEPVVNDEQITLAQWMSETYLTPIGQVLWLFLPPGITGQTERIITLLERDADVLDAVRGQKRQAIVEVLRQNSNPMLERELEKAVNSKHLRPQLRALQEADILRVEARLAQPSAHHRMIATVQLIVSADMLLRNEGGRKLGTRQRRIIEYLLPFDGAVVDVPDVTANAYAAPSDLRKMAQYGWMKLGERQEVRDSLLGQVFEPHPEHRLTPDQQVAFDAIAQALNQERGDVFVLHGVTGAGKTEVYLQAIAHALTQGKQALVLVPEIALTPQTVGRIVGRFGGAGGRVAIVHGRLSVGERYDTWQRARRGEIDVIVGTRSACFTVLPNLGIIVLDEEHDASYKHAPPMHPPYYHARDVAVQMAQRQGAPLILASATPDLETYQRAQRGDYVYVPLARRIATGGKGTHIDLPPVHIVDMRDELRSGNRTMFSRALQASLADVLGREEQAILLLNRRGQATYIFCRDCGYVLECANCDTPLTYHRAGEQLRCHHCGHQQNPPKTCPECGGEHIRYFGAGTQQVESKLQEIFPEARLLRWDADTTPSPEQHESILRTFREHHADILIGTQMIAKGLDLPRVTLVGVVSADPGLNLPDYRAPERGFQLLSQVAGRAGRSERGGHVIIQTYQPQHPTIVATAQHDYASWADEALQTRREIGYPPFRRLARILVLNQHPIHAEREAKHIAHDLQTIINDHNYSDASLIGAVPCFFRRINKDYRWQVIVRSPDPAQVLRHFTMRQGIYVDIDPVDLL
jgi:primosomal protein N' (replication factor Y)